MADIFRLASRAVIWLGPEAEDSDLAMRVLSHISSYVEVDWWRRHLWATEIGRRDPTLSLQHFPLPYDEQITCAIEQLYLRPWFKRVCVVQEARLAGRSTIVQCGFRTLLWWRLLDCVVIICLKGFILPRSPKHGSHRLTLIRQFMVKDQEQSNTFLHMLVGCRDSKCSDDRDRVYALLGVVNDYQRSYGVTPDYTRSKSEVYEDLVRRHVLHGDLDILKGCDIGTRQLEGPTWVPDWANCIYSSHLYLTAAFVDADAKIIDNGILQLAGVQVGTVSGVGPRDEEKDQRSFLLFFNWIRAIAPDDVQLPAPSYPTASASRVGPRDPFHDFFTWIRAIAPNDVLTTSYPTGCSLLEAFCEVIKNLCSWGAERPPPPIHELMAMVRELLIEPFDYTRVFRSINERGKHYIRQFELRSGWRMFCTREGYIGTGRLAVAPGDVVCAPFGCSAPLLLRPVIDSDNFQVVGECFVHGVQYGEPILGSLPSWSRVAAGDSAPPGKHLWVFLDDRKGGELSCVDPRLRRAGIDVRVDEKGFPYKMTLEEVRALGVNFRYFNLV
ncbi:hypothetical protein F4778DRAFT_789571 [Xylariomycetidae sp. FL2044]|nr:hypothetical protein F4778DRAFT_789571 [Xylariomycetidae sp. FL2044]